MDYLDALINCIQLYSVKVSFKLRRPLNLLILLRYIFTGAFIKDHEITFEVTFIKTVIVDDVHLSLCLEVVFLMKCSS